MKPKEPRHLYLRRRLAETTGLHLQISRETGVAQSTVSRIFRGNVPRLDTADKLLDWFERFDRSSIRKDLVRRRAARAQQ
jgi:transcriptional regulator with XRE-family HTH domain